MKKIAIIVAGGQGIRMKGALPKQFLDLCGEPILFHTIRKFKNAGCEIIVVINADYKGYWEQLCVNNNFKIPHQLTSGGATRADSVLNGLNLIQEDALVAVHDAVRPLLSLSLIHNLFEAAEKLKAVIPVLEVKDSLRKTSDEGSVAINRSEYKSVQTPQIFQLEILKNAFNVNGYEKFTDEASLVEASGTTIHLLEGEDFNIKITNPSDLIFAEAILKSTNHKY